MTFYTPDKDTDEQMEPNDRLPQFETIPVTAMLWAIAIKGWPVWLLLALAIALLFR